MLRRPAESGGRVVGGAAERFPGYDVVGEVARWDAVTAGAVLSRLGPSPPVRFFTMAEEAIGRALFDRLLDQTDEPRVPILEMVDARLAESETDGWRYDELPEDGDAFRVSFAALDEDAQHFGFGFAALEVAGQDKLIQDVHDLGENPWHGLRADRVWSLWTRYACTAFYSHPWAWNEIGFGGPAYPRGYKNIGIDSREPWEVADALDRDPVALERGTK
jgi:hypothetical protein